MRKGSFPKTLCASAGLAAVIACAGALINTPRAYAQDDGSGDQSRIQQGFQIAPVTLNLAGKNRALVGLGSYLVNAGGACNDCHTRIPYAPQHDPYLGQPKKVNPDGYLGGGQSFGPFTSRNITPDKTGLPEGHTFDQFLSILRTGIDMEKVHPQISPLLQVMPWPVYGNLTDHDIRAIYEYLSTIPCVEGEPGEPVQPANRCK